jgi:DNA-binding Lrp family transcriptional regulator
LHALANLEYGSYRELSRKLEMPQTTMTYRIKRLEDQNVIVGWFLPMASRKLGMHGFRLLLDLKYPTPGIKNDIQSFCEHQPCVIGMVNCLGNWEYELQVEVDDPEYISTLTSELQRHFKVINQVHVLTMLKEYRFSSFPIDEGKRTLN